jgi:hypothetical protein
MPPRLKKVRVIEPATIRNSSQWADAYKGNYKNIVLGKNGELIVKDVTLASVAKIIPHESGYDATTVLASATTKELRAAVYEGALEKAEEIHKTLEVNTQSKRTLFLTTERELLQTIQEYKNEEDKALRRNLVLKIGELTHALQTADEGMRNSMYTHRTLDTIAIPKMLIDYPTKDDRTILVNRITLQTNGSVHDRAFTVEDTA